MSMKAQRRIDECQPAETLDLDFARSVVAGLARPDKAIPSRFFYDARGSELFEEITQLPEYYPTRTETAILEKYATEMTAGAPAGSSLIEFGSGSSRKTEILLAAMPELYAYVPIDISQSALADAAERLAQRLPKLRVLPVVGDFSQPLKLDDAILEHPRVGFFPGSTIGNLEPGDAVNLLAQMARVLGSGSRFIIGVDLKKDVDRLVAAYSDSAGVTADFNFNLLERINRELGADFNVPAFEHSAVYNAEDGRMESYLVSKVRQQVTLFGRNVTFEAGESIHTENSHKYDLEEFDALVRKAGWSTVNVWNDEDHLFSVHELIAG